MALQPTGSSGRVRYQHPSPSGSFVLFSLWSFSSVPCSSKVDWYATDLCWCAGGWGGGGGGLCVWRRGGGGSAH